MGLPVEQPEHDTTHEAIDSDRGASSSTSSHPPPASSTTPTSMSSLPGQYPSSSVAHVSQLPPAALALAAKLFDHARAGDTAVLQQYLEAGIPANLTNHEGNTILMLSSYHGHANTTQMLLSRGADVNVVNSRGQTPLAGAVFKGYMDVIRVLYEDGRADPAAGQPCAIDTAKMFRREQVLRMFGVPESEWTDLPGNFVLPGPPVSMS